LAQTAAYRNPLKIGAISGAVAGDNLGESCGLIWLDFFALKAPFYDIFFRPPLEAFI